MSLEEIEKEVLEEIKKVKNIDDLRLIKVKYLGRNGILTEAAKKIPQLKDEE